MKKSNPHVPLRTVTVELAQVKGGIRSHIIGTGLDGGDPTTDAIHQAPQSGG